MFNVERLDSDSGSCFSAGVLRVGLINKIHTRLGGFKSFLVAEAIKMLQMDTVHCWINNGTTVCV